MEEKILEILRDINEDILCFTGKSLYEEGLLDSFQFIELVARIEDEFEIEIDPELVVIENFLTKEVILDFVKKLLAE